MEKFEEEIDLHTFWAPRTYCFIFYDIYLYIFMSLCKLQFYTIKIMEGILGTFLDFLIVLLELDLLTLPGLGS